MVNGMAMKAACLGNDLDDEARQEKMRQALDALKKVWLMLKREGRSLSEEIGAHPRRCAFFCDIN